MVRLQDAGANRFDAGVQASDWLEQFRPCGLEVKQAVCKGQAASVHGVSN
jgi:hypothetical protein